MKNARTKIAPSRKQANAVALICILASIVFAAFYLTWFAVTCGHYRETGVDTLSTLSTSAFPPFVILLLMLVALVGGGHTQFGKQVLCWLFTHRFLIGVCIVISMTLLKISGSSVAVWKNTLQSDVADGVLLGIPRGIRVDELLVNTPFAFSQAWTGYSPVSELLRGAPTDVTVIYAQPCWSFSTLFRPFLWGYLFLGSEVGLAFFWVGRLVTLFLVSIEMGMLLCDKRSGISVAFACLVTFSTVVQWWFAVNGIAELLIFGQALVLVLHHFLRTDNVRVRVLLALLLSWLATGFLLVFYPAWQIPFFYIFLAIGIGDLVAWLRGIERSERKRQLTQALPFLGLAFALVATFAAISILPVWDTVKASMNTEYPGHRFDYGGGYADRYTGLEALFMWIPSLFNSLQATFSAINSCELSGFYSLFPLGLCFGIVGQILVRKSGNGCSPTIISLILSEALLLIYIVFGLPAPIAEVSLLASSRVIRAAQIIGYADIAIIIATIPVFIQFAPETFKHRAEKGDHSPLTRFAGFVGVGIIGSYLLLCVYMTHYVFGLRWGFTAFAILLISSTILALILVCFDRKYDCVLLICAIATTVAGLCVNPVQVGAGSLLNSESYHSIQRIAAEDDSLWAGDNSKLGQLCVSAGAPCINSVNTYPVLERWAQLDQNGQHASIYNRYAHIYINIVGPESNEPKFSAHPYADSFITALNVDDLYAMGVRYYVSFRDDLEQLPGDNHKFILLESTESVYIYQITPSQQAVQ